MKRVIFSCDITICNFETDDLTKIYPSRILGKEYDLCNNCRKSLDEFIQRMLAEGHNPEAQKDIVPGQGIPGIKQPSLTDPNPIWITSTPPTVTSGGYPLPKTVYGTPEFPPVIGGGKITYGGTGGNFSGLTIAIDKLVESQKEK